MNRYYWTKYGERFHEDKSCSSLRNSKNIFSGTLMDAELAGHTVACQICSASFVTAEVSPTQNGISTKNGIDALRSLYGENLVERCYSFFPAVQNLSAKDIPDAIIHEYHKQPDPDFISCVYLFLSYYTDWDLPQLFSKVYKEIYTTNNAPEKPVQTVPASPSLCQGADQLTRAEKETPPASTIEAYEPVQEQTPGNDGADSVEQKIPDALVLQQIPDYAAPNEHNVSDNAEVKSQEQVIDLNHITVYWSKYGTCYHASADCFDSLSYSGTIPEAIRSGRRSACQRCARQYSGYKYAPPTFTPIPEPKPQTPFHISLLSFFKKHILFFVFVIIPYLFLAVTLLSNSRDFQLIARQYSEKESYIQKQQQKHYESVLDSWRCVGTVTYKVTPIDKERKTEDWDHAVYINGKQIKYGDKIMLYFGREYKIKALSIEYDPTYDDIGETTSNYLATSTFLQSLYSPGKTLTINTNTKETRGPAAGTSTKHRFDICITTNQLAPDIILNYKETSEGEVEYKKRNQLYQKRQTIKNQLERNLSFLKKRSAFVFIPIAWILELILKKFY